MVGRPQTLWSVDQATFEWNGPKTESLVNDFLHKRAKMCNSDFLDCKLKSQKLNYRFDSISWIYVTLWYQKKRREDRLMCWYTLHLIALRDTDLYLCPRYSSMQFWNTTAKLHKSCRGANFPGCISLSGTAYSCFIVISPFVAVRNIPIWAKMDSSRRVENIPSSWYKRWRWTQFATAIIVSRQTVPVPLILGQIG